MSERRSKPSRAVASSCEPGLRANSGDARGPPLGSREERACLRTLGRRGFHAGARRGDAGVLGLAPLHKLRAQVFRDLGVLLHPLARCLAALADAVALPAVVRAGLLQQASRGGQVDDLAGPVDAGAVEDLELRLA